MQEEIRIDDLWFSGDTIVIKAEKKIFRVTKSILAARSSVFRDMLAFPQPASGEAEVLGGSPVVSLHDSAADVEVFLRAIFDSSYFIPTEPSSFDFKLQTVLGILRLAHKYDVLYLVRRALEFLSYGNGAWRRALDEWSVDQGEPACVRYMSTIAAATEVGALWLLPVLYYQASKYPEDRLRLALAHGIDSNIVQRCLSAHGHLSRGTTAVNVFLTIPSETGCTSPKHCDRVRFRRLGNYFEHVRRKVDLAPLDDWSNEEWEVVARELCGNCLKKAKESHRATLVEFWDQLPGIYGLPPWRELKAMKRSAMTNTV